MTKLRIFLFNGMLILHNDAIRRSLAFIPCKTRPMAHPFRLGKCHFISENQVDSMIDLSSIDHLEAPNNFLFSLSATERGFLAPDVEPNYSEEDERKVWSSMILSLFIPVISLFPSRSEAADVSFSSEVGQQISTVTTMISEQMIDPSDMEALALTDTSRFLMDVSSFLTTEKIILRLASIISRFMNIEIGVSVTPNHLTPSPLEEVIFQAAMMGVSLSLLSKTALPLILSYGLTSSVPFRDRVMYHSLFHPVGVSWLQFRTMMSLAVLEWVEFAPDTITPTGLPDSPASDNAMGQYIYWLYRGDAQVILQRSDTIVRYNLKRRHGKSVLPQKSNGGNDNSQKQSAENNISSLDDFGLIADMNFVEMLGERKSSSDKRKGHDFLCPMPLIQSGPTGAVFVRINGKKLVQLMDDDDKLDLSIRSLLLQCARSNLMTLLAMK